MRNRLTAVGEEDVPDTPTVAQQPLQPPPQSPATQAALAGLIIALKALSQRTIVALASLFDLVLIGSAFVLWWQIIDDPNALRITAAGMYSGFIASVLLMRRRQ